MYTWNNKNISTVYKLDQMLQDLKGTQRVIIIIIQFVSFQQETATTKKNQNLKKLKGIVYLHIQTHIIQSIDYMIDSAK